MWRQKLTAVISLMVLISWTPTSRAQDATAELMNQIGHDVTALSVNTPIWLAQHLPATMPSSSIGVAPDHSDAAGLTLGVTLPRLGLFNQFSEVGNGTEFLGFDDELPGNMFWPQFGINASVRMGIGLELSANVEGIPNMALGGDTVTVEVGSFSAGANLRWRITPSLGPLPGLVVGVGAAYSTGVMKFGINGRANYTVPLEVENPIGGMIETDVSGTYSFMGGPEMAWSMTQIAPEVRMVWSLGAMKPFVGVSVGITNGEVQGGAEVTTQVEVSETSVEGITIDAGKNYESTRTELYSTVPARFTIRPHMGVDFQLGALAIAAQVDFAFMNNEQVSTDVDTGALDDFDPAQEGGVFGDASQESQTSAAVVGSLAIRVVF